jgi:hypothetical protein
MYADYIFNCPSATEFDNLSDEVKGIIKWLVSEWPTFPMIDTHDVSGRRLLHVRMNQMLTKAMLDDMLLAHGLDWQILSIRSAYKEDFEEGLDAEGKPVKTPIYKTGFLADKALFLPFLNPIWVSQTESRPVTLADDIYLSTYAGTEPLHL